MKKYGVLVSWDEGRTWEKVAEATEAELDQVFMQQRGAALVATANRAQAENYAHPLKYAALDFAELDDQGQPMTGPEHYPTHLHAPPEQFGTFR